MSSNGCVVCKLYTYRLKRAWEIIPHGTSQLACHDGVMWLVESTLKVTE
jgi:hypothetical protein